MSVPFRPGRFVIVARRELNDYVVRRVQEHLLPIRAFSPEEALDRAKHAPPEAWESAWSPYEVEEEG